MNTEQNSFNKAIKELSGALNAMDEIFTELSNSLQKLSKNYIDATKPKQGREAFRNFVESKEKKKNRYRR